MLKKRYVISFSAASLALMGILAACGGGGGGGSDSQVNSTVIEGNVADQVAALRPVQPTLFAKLQKVLTLVDSAQAALSGVGVSIRNTGLATVTDDNGFFRVEGDVGGDLIIDFTLPDATISLGLSVPAGSRVTLQNVTLNRSTGQAAPQSTDVRSNDDGEDGSSNTNANSNSNANANGDDDDDGNANSNVNSNDDDDDGSSNSNSNVNSNEDDDNDDNSNANSNEDDDNSNSNSNEDDDGGSSGGGSNSGSGGGSSGSGGSGSGGSGGGGSGSGGSGGGDSDDD